jgi:hypothetical protein
MRQFAFAVILASVACWLSGAAIDAQAQDNTTQDETAQDETAQEETAREETARDETVRNDADESIRQQESASQPAEDTAAAENDSTAGRIARVTLYRDQALVTREIPVDIDGDSNVITIGDLPEMLLPDSVFAEGDEHVEIRGVRVSSQPATSSNRDEVRSVQEQLQTAKRSIEQLQQQLQIAKAELESIAQIVNFTAAKANDDLQNGSLNPESVIQLNQYLSDQRSESMLRQLATQQELEVATEQQNVLQLQLNELTAGIQRTRYEAKIFIDATASGVVRLNYQVSGCGWSPQYAIRGAVDSDQFTIRYSALVQQISGEPWEQVALTLSTASPSISSNGPTLTPFRVAPQPIAPNQSGDPFGAPSSDSKSLTERFQSIKKQQRSAEVQNYNAPATRSGEFQRDFALNNLAADLQQLELDAEASSAARLAADADDEVATQVYTIPKPVSLQSRRQQQLVQIQDLQLGGSLYHVGTPLLSSYAYREAEISNTEPIGLLGGPASVYLNDRFVGKTELPTTASGQKVVVGFGADQQVRIRRELRDKKDVLRGGNRNLEFTYRLVVANFKDRPVAVRLYDRVPVASETREVVVNLTQTSLPLSDDKLYERINKDQGILRWDLQIPADSYGASAFDVEYTYNLDFDKNRVLTTAGLTQQMDADLFFQRSAPSGGGMGGQAGPMQQSQGPPLAPQP